MKLNNKLLLFGLLGSVCMLFTRCEEETLGDPEIEMVRAIAPELADQALNSVGLGETIVVKGSNLGAVTEVSINGLAVNVRSTFVTNTHMVITVPDETPNIATSPDISNMLVVKSGSGADSISITVLPPSPQVARISNEFANAGDEVTITGKFFFFVEDVVFPGGISSPAFVASSDGTTITATVPDGITEAGLVEVVTESGSGDSGPKQTFNDRSGVVLDWDDHTFWQNWGVNPGVTSGGFNGNYLNVQADGPITPASWWVGPTAFVVDGAQDADGLTPTGLSGPTSDYVLRMEVKVPEDKPWTSGWLELEIGADEYFGRWMPWTSPAPGTNNWHVPDPADVGTAAFHTSGKWMTIDYPMAWFAPKSGGNPDPAQAINNMSTLLTDEGKFEVRMVFQNPNEGENGGTEIAAGLDISYDNIRVVKVVE
ncbi:glycan-binding surface protein [Marinoscillum furvescens]|uniref:Surface glycan-binding protein B xyloglucan binding domain-containing protein n=1 Tax=Marinoscillum furvescens DSM 4134 TaxID=1122208 RepID=A0A3D9KXU1_MARFU|nr:glycan-binding surface protein [Marinoscillum furvescens]RED92019.1 hypothetical protein C7460_13412 [Marinoscillum furvescens DSM 4134]